jgi:hypothetical protein
LPQLASFINSDDSFANFRRFGYLSARVLVHLELELTELEQELDKLDNSDAASDVLKKRLNGYEKFHGWNEDQKKLVDKIRRKYIEYGKILSQSLSRYLHTTRTSANVQGSRSLGKGLGPPSTWPNYRTKPQTAPELDCE